MPQSTDLFILLPDNTYCFTNYLAKKTSDQLITYDVICIVSKRKFAFDVRM